MKSTTTIGLDLAKEVFQVHGVDADQKATVTRALKRKDVVTFFSKLPKCLVGMEACGGAHFWARELKALGHEVKLMVPRYVKGYAKRGKNDAADAAAICEAVSRRHVEEVGAKTVEQQCLLMLHKVRDGLVATRTEKINIVRAHLLELGIAAPVGQAGFEQLLVMLRDEACKDDAGKDIPPLARAALLPLVAVLDAIEQSIAGLDGNIRRAHASDETSRRLETIPGVGMLGATAFAAVAAEAKAYKSARHYAASLGLTPRITGTGGEVELGPISKQGNGYLRRLLYHDMSSWKPCGCNGSLNSARICAYGLFSTCAMMFRRPRCAMPMNMESAPASAASPMISSRIGTVMSSPSIEKRVFA